MNLARLRVLAPVVSALALTLVALSALPASAQTAQATAPAKAPARKSAAFDASPCLGCHAPVKELYESGQAQGRRLQQLPRRHRRAPGRRVEAADDEDRSRHLRRLPPEPVQVLCADGLAPHRALREEADGRPRARSGVRPADDRRTDSPRSTTCRARTRSRCSTSTSSTARSAAASRRRKAGATSLAPATST